MGTSYKDRLEGGYQLLRIRRLKGWIAAGVIGATAALVAFSLLAAGASAKPLFMPVDAFLPVLLVMLFIGAVLQMFFRSLGVKYARKDSQRFLMIKNSMSRATWVVVVGIAVAVALLVPPTHAAIDGSLNAPPSVESLRPGFSLPLSFESQDGLGLTRYVGVAVTLTSGSSLDVIVARGAATPQRMILTTTAPALAIPIDVNSFALFIIVPLIAIAFVVSNAGFLFYVQPLREKYEKASIYSIEYAQRVGSGERLYTEYEAPAPAARAVPVGGGAGRGAAGPPRPGPAPPAPPAPPPLGVHPAPPPPP